MSLKIHTQELSIPKVRRHLHLKFIKNLLSLAVAECLRSHNTEQFTVLFTPTFLGTLESEGSPSI